jgi:hypothetical protein
MKTDPTGNQDEALHRVLQEWRADAALPPGFQDHVWLRIERVQAPATPSAWAAIIKCFEEQLAWLRIERAQASTASSAWAAIMHWIDTVLPRPALAASYVSALLVIGGTAGWTQAHQTSVHVREELGQRYVRAVDPYLAARE